MSTPPDVVIVRLRPDTMPNVGMPRERARELAVHLSGKPKPLVDFRRATFASEAGLIETTQVARALADCRIVVLDLDFPMVQIRRGRVDRLLADVLTSVAHHVTDEHRLVIVMTEQPASPDDIAGVLRGPPYAAVSAVVSSNSEPPAVAATWVMSDQAIAACRTSSDDVKHQFAERLLRRRGVFRSNVSDEYLAYHYSSLQGDGSLRALIEDYIAESPSDLVLFDKGLSPWLGEVVLSAAIDASLTAATVEEFLGRFEKAGDRDSARRRKKLRELTGDPDTHVVVILPMVKSGRTATRVAGELRSAGLRYVRVLAIMIEERLSRGAPSPFHLDLGSAVIEVDYLVEVGQPSLDATDWRLEAAIAGRYVELPASDWTSPSPIGMWSLYAHVGVGPESPLPRSSERRAFRWLPKLRSMPDRDAVWMAECLVRLATSHLGTHSSEMVFLVPDEQSGARPLASALERRTDIAVIRFDRNDLNDRANDSSRLDYLSRYAGYRIVVADESTVSYHTMRQFEALVKRALNRPPDLGVVMLDLGSRSDLRPSWLQSLHNWRPGRVVELEEETELGVERV